MALCGGNDFVEKALKTKTRFWYSPYRKASCASSAVGSGGGMLSFEPMKGVLCTELFKLLGWNIGWEGVGLGHRSGFGWFLSIRGGVPW